MLLLGWCLSFFLTGVCNHLYRCTDLTDRQNFQLLNFAVNVKCISCFGQLNVLSLLLLQVVLQFQSTLAIKIFSYLEKHFIYRWLSVRFCNCAFFANTLRAGVCPTRGAVLSLMFWRLGNSGCMCLSKKCQLVLETRTPLYFSAGSWYMFTFLECNTTRREMGLYLQPQSYTMFPKEEMTGYTEEWLGWSVTKTAGRQFFPVNAAFGN